MKKIKYLLFLVVLTILSVGGVSAASFSVTTNKNTVVVGNSVSITVSVNGKDAAGWEYCLNYDSSVFELTSHNTKCILGGTLAGNKTVTFKLKAKKSGSSTFSLSAASILDDSANSVMSSKGSVTVRAKTQAEIEASYSTNANLSSLRVVDHVITPEFDKNILEYNLEVENAVEKVTIKASKADRAANVNGDGEKELTEGLNKFEIVVTAEKGNKKTYVVNITRKELDPIHVDVDGFKYTVVRKANGLEAPTYYTSTEIEVQGEKVPAFVSDITGYTLVGLKDEEGNVSLYRYTDKEEYVLYNQTSVDGVVFVPLYAEKLLDDYQLNKNIKINDINVKAYYGENKSEYLLVYGMNVATGKTSWYRYDTKDKTLQRYVEEKEESVSDIYFLLTIVFASISGLAILLVMILIVTNTKVRNKNAKLISMLKALRDAEKEESEEESEEVEKQIVKNNKEKEKQKELREKQEEFMETSENEMVEDDVEIEEDVEETKLKRGRKKKES